MTPKSETNNSQDISVCQKNVVSALPRSTLRVAELALFNSCDLQPSISAQLRNYIWPAMVLRPRSPVSVPKPSDISTFEK
jgi:hypothetical protein